MFSNLSVEGLEVWPVKIINTAGQTLKQTLLNTEDGPLWRNPKSVTNTLVAIDRDRPRLIRVLGTAGRGPWLAVVGRGGVWLIVFGRCWSPLTLVGRN